MQRCVASLPTKAHPGAHQTCLEVFASRRGQIGEAAPIICPGYQGRFQHQLFLSERAHGQTVARNAPCANLREESDRTVAMDQKGRLFRGRDMCYLFEKESQALNHQVFFDSGDDA